MISSLILFCGTLKRNQVINLEQQIQQKCKILTLYVCLYQLVDMSRSDSSMSSLLLYMVKFFIYGQKGIS